MTAPADLVLDLGALQGEHPDRGIPRFVRSHASALVASGRVRGMFLDPNMPAPSSLPPALSPSRGLALGTATAFRRASAAGAVAYHCMSLFEFGSSAAGGRPFEAVVPPFLGQSPLVVTAYDLIPLTFPAVYLTDPDVDARYRTRLLALRHADLVLAISVHTRNELLRRLSLDPARVAVIGAAVDDFFHGPHRGDELTAVRATLPEITRPFILCVPGFEPRKNVEGLIAGYGQLSRRLRAQFQLVVACSLPEGGRAHWSALASAAGIGRGDAVFTNWVPDETLRALYRTASISVTPSRAEGFGLPAAEAATSGTAVLVSNVSGLPEIVGLNEATFDPDDADDLARVMTRTLTDEAFRQRLAHTGLERSRAWRWDAVAARTISALDRLANHRSRRRTSARLRIGLCGPFPPTNSGVADYNRRIAIALAARCDLECFVDPPEGEPNRDRDRVPQLPLAALGAARNAYGFDALIYTVGNSDAHHGVLDAARRFPGIVWFHDTSLAGLYTSYAHAHNRSSAQARNAVVAVLSEQYGRESFSPPAHGWRDTTIYDRAGVGFTRELATLARAVIVNSQVAAEQLAADQPTGRVAAPLATIPLAVPALPIGLAQTRIRDGVPVIVSAGRVSPFKAPDVLLDAAALVRAEREIIVAFVGHASARERAWLQQLAADRDLSGHVVVTGSTSERDYWEWITGAAAAVQLRWWSRGESSAAVNDCVAAGIPVLTNVASAVEIPTRLVQAHTGELSGVEVAAWISSVLSAPRPEPASDALHLMSVDDVAEAIVAFVGRAAFEGWSDGRASYSFS